MELNEDSSLSQVIGSTYDDPNKDENEFSDGHVEIPLEQYPTTPFESDTAPLRLTSRLGAQLITISPGWSPVPLAWDDLSRDSLTVMAVSAGVCFLSDDPTFLNDMLSATGSSNNVFIASTVPTVLTGFTGTLWAFVPSTAGAAVTVQAISVRNLK